MSDKLRKIQEELASFVGAEVETVLAQHNELIRKQTRISAGILSGHIAAAICVLSRRRHQAIDAMQDELAGLAQDFVANLAAIAARRDQATDRPRSARDVSEPEIKRLGSMKIEDWAGPVSGPTLLEARFGIARSTLYRWQQRKEVIALRKGGRKHVFPLRQFVDGRPAPGISEVLSIIKHPRSAWFWLTHPCPRLGNRSPIDVLRTDSVADVIREAWAYSASLTGGI